MARITAGIISTAWAETGDKVSFEDLLPAGSRARTAGFDTTYSQPGGKKPERELVNNEINILNNFVLDVQLHGVLEWNTGVTYNMPTLVFGSDGELYTAKRNSGPTPLSAHNPVTDSTETYWEPFYKSLPALTLAQIPDLPASKIASGIIDLDRIPDLPASKTTSGTFSGNRIPGLPASQTVSGVFHVDRIPDLDASKITTGEFDIDRIPDIPATKISGFVTPTVLGAENIPITITTAQVSGTANAILLSPAPAWTAYTIGRRFLFRPNLDSTGNVTINISGLGVRQVWWWDKRLAADGFIRTRIYECVIYSSTRIYVVGTQFGDAVLYNVGSNSGKLVLLESNNRFHADRIPDLPASRVTSGTISISRIPNLDASKITSGVFDLDRIPDLPASKTTSGVFDLDRIPNLPATKTTSGIFNIARIPDVPFSKITDFGDHVFFNYIRAKLGDTYDWWNDLFSDVAVNSVARDFLGFARNLNNLDTLNNILTIGGAKKLTNGNFELRAIQEIGTVTVTNSPDSGEEWLFWVIR